MKYVGVTICNEASAQLGDIQAVGTHTADMHTVGVHTVKHAMGLRRGRWRPAARVFAAAVFAAAIPCAAAAGTLPDALGENLVAGYIAPSMQRFSEAAVGLQSVLGAYCDGTARAPASTLLGGPSEARADMAALASVAHSARVEISSAAHAGIKMPTGAPARMPGSETVVDAQFLLLAQAWSRIQFLRFGPLVEDNRFERIFFWPDPRGMMTRQLQRLLAQEPPVQEGEGIASQSVAIQGLPALEYLLYREHGLLAADAQAWAAFGRDCHYAEAIAANLVRLGSELAAAWRVGGPYAVRFARPSRGNPLYRTTAEVAAEAIKALSTGIQFVHDVELAPALGKAGDAINARRLPFWRSGHSTQAMAASARGLAAFHAAGRFDYAPREAWIGSLIANELGRAADALGNSARDGDDAPQLLRIAALQLKNAKSIIDQDMASVFGATVGFNALDGD
ncbi:aminopeptidase [Pusillimonas sp. TS35]|uniref:imelysin family protein n=1 Tax=Paracandidimonas lactea TaxID=2895524 RepID=UPI00136FBA92|nr:imelysin family protein [Paracandidimonas lactea]MYN13448.1 aminopeptidase [Pusillimonas sp. TS35]